MLLVGLGNPGTEYAQTRHNVGFMAVDELVRRYSFDSFKSKFKGQITTGTIDTNKVMLLKPETYMNLSGESVLRACTFYKIKPEDVIVFHDDMDLAVGKVKVKRGGSAGGHNGLKSIIQHLGTDQFPRIRVGVGEKPHPDYDLADWVLGKFVGEDKKAIDAAVKKAADAIECILKDGMDRGMNKFNG